MVIVFCVECRFLIKVYLTVLATSMHLFKKNGVILWMIGYKWERFIHDYILSYEFSTVIFDRSFRCRLMFKLDILSHLGDFYP